MRSLLASKLPPSFTPAFATKAGSLSFPPTLRPIAALAGIGALVAAGFCARGTFAGAAVEMRGLDPVPVALAGVVLLLALAASAAAWRSALRSAGAGIGVHRAWGCYGLGSLANAVLPARLGDAVRVGLFARHVDHRQSGRLSGYACLAVAGSRAVVYVLMCAVGAALGLLPRWLLLAAFVLVAPIACRQRLARLGLAPAVFAWVTLSAAGRLTAGAAVLHALDVDNPVGSAFVGLTALAAASTLPLAPGVSASPAPGWQSRSSSPVCRPRARSPLRSRSMRSRPWQASSSARPAGSPCGLPGRAAGKVIHMRFRHYRGKVPPNFAHPAEEELAELLDEEGIPWEYEPHTFPLERGPDGTVHQAITPDFYLPDADAYIECTVMKQSNVNKKNQKVRKLRERYGEVVTVFYRRDFRRLREKYRNGRDEIS